MSPMSPACTRGGDGSVKIKLKIKNKSDSGLIMINIELKSRNFEKLQRFSAFSRKSEQISFKSAKIATNFENLQFV